MQHTEEFNNSHLLRKGRNFLGVINDLKRTTEAAAKELGVSKEDLDDFISGKNDLPQEVFVKASKIWPVNMRDFYLLEDDAPHGVSIMRAEQSASSSRVFQRGGKDYYEYRDTAMTRICSFRPEWIKELCVVDNNDPENKEVHWNNGHFMHQFTYFIGPVNFYYLEKGKRKVAMMNTGDSMYITPFIPHTFAVRKNPNNEEGLILALTYGDKVVGDTQHELSAVGEHLASNFFLDFSSREKAFASLLKFNMENASITLEELSKATSINVDEIKSYESATTIPSFDILKKIATTLGITVRELLPPDNTDQKVVVSKHENCRVWHFPSANSNGAAYKITDLASSSNLPFSKALEITVLKEQNNNLDLRSGLHQYAYNLGDNNVILQYFNAGKRYTETIKPGDSLYIKPFIEHSFSSSGKPSKLMVLRIAGKLAGEPMREMSLLGRHTAKRVVGETMQWYDPKNKK